MDRPLFVYGTLRDPELLAAVLGRRVDPRAVAAAEAPGFRTVHYPGRTYPALIRSAGEAAQGQILLGLSRLERRVLDAYEGEEYRRGLIPVLVEQEMHEAETYLPTLVIAPTAEAWTLENWQKIHKPTVLASEGRLAARLRAEIAAGPPPLPGRSGA